MKPYTSLKHINNVFFPSSEESASCSERNWNIELNAFSVHNEKLKLLVIMQHLSIPVLARVYQVSFYCYWFCYKSRVVCFLWHFFSPFFPLPSEGRLLNIKIPAYRTKRGMKIFVLHRIRLGNEKITICGTFLITKYQNIEFLRYSAASVRKKILSKNTLFRTCFLENSYEKKTQTTTTTTSPIDSQFLIGCTSVRWFWGQEVMLFHASKESSSRCLQNTIAFHFST